MWQWDKKAELHAKAKAELVRLFPNHVVDVGPAETEPEPEPEITDKTGDDFEGEAPQTCHSYHEEPLQTAGKLAKLWAAVAKHVKLELHNNGKTEHMRPTQMNVLTGELVMDVKEDESMTSTAVFFVSLEHCDVVLRKLE